MRSYTDAERVQALASLELNAGNLSKTARATGVPIGTLSLWRNSALAAAPERPLKPAELEKTDWAQVFADALREAVASLRSKIPDMGGRDTAIAVGILADKHLDYRDGRKSASVNVDARSVNLTQLTDEQLARLADGR